MKATLNMTQNKPFLEALLSGDRSACSLHACEYLKENHSIQELYENVFNCFLI